MISAVRIGTRGSDLALRQTNSVADALRNAYPDLLLTIRTETTTGDQRSDIPLTQFEGAGVFTSAIEALLHAGEIDLAVHSYKDLPIQEVEGVIVGAVPLRQNPADVLISREGYTLETLPQGASVGTSSRRRSAQLLYHRPDLHILDLRGNVDTRIRKALAADSPYDAIVLAFAGLARLERTDVITQILPLDIMLPAPAQGALAVQCRDLPEWHSLLTSLHHLPSAAAVAAERAFLAALGGGCAMPVAAHGFVEGNTLYLTGRICSPEGKIKIEVSGQADFVDEADGERLGAAVAEQARHEGAATLLEMPL